MTLLFLHLTVQYGAAFIVDVVVCAPGFECRIHFTRWFSAEAYIRFQLYVYANRDVYIARGCSRCLGSAEHAFSLDGEYPPRWQVVFLYFDSANVTFLVKYISTFT